MVNEPISVDGDPGTSGNDPLGPLVIEDTTDPAQLEREAAVVSGRDPDNLESPEQVAGVPEFPVEGAGLEPVQPPAAEQTPASQEDVKRLIDERTAAIQSAADKRVAEEQKQRRLAEERNEQINLEARIEATLRQQETSLAESMGEEDARQYVRGANADNVKAQLTNEIEVNKLRQQTAEAGTQNRAVWMREWLQEVQRINSLSNEDVQALTSMVSQETLRSDAAFIATGEAISQVAERLKGRTSGTVVPRETPGTNPGTGRSTNNTPTSDVSLTASARDKPAWSWSKEEHAAMRRSSFGG